MGFFDKLFGKKEEQQDLKPSSNKGEPIIGDMQFDIEGVYESLQIYDLSSHSDHFSYIVPLIT